MTATVSAFYRLQTYLRENGVSFTLRHHPLAFRAQKLATAENLPGRCVAKPVIAVVDGRPVMVVVPASCVVQMSKLAHALGAATAQLADEEALVGLFPDCEIGALPPFGNLYGLEVLVDRHMAESPHFEFRAGTHTETIGVLYSEFARLIQPRVVDVAHTLRCTNGR